MFSRGKKELQQHFVFPGEKGPTAAFISSGGHRNYSSISFRGEKGSHSSIYFFRGKKGPTAAFISSGGKRNYSSISFSGGKRNPLEDFLFFRGKKELQQHLFSRGKKDLPHHLFFQGETGTTAAIVFSGGKRIPQQHVFFQGEKGTTAAFFFRGKKELQQHFFFQGEKGTHCSIFFQGVKGTTAAFSFSGGKRNYSSIFFFRGKKELQQHLFFQGETGTTAAFVFPGETGTTAAFISSGGKRNYSSISFSGGKRNPLQHSFFQGAKGTTAAFSFSGVKRNYSSSLGPRVVHLFLKCTWRVLAHLFFPGNPKPVVHSSRSIHLLMLDFRHGRRHSHSTRGRHIDGFGSHVRNFRGSGRASGTRPRPQEGEPPQLSRREGLRRLRGGDGSVARGGPSLVAGERSKGPNGFLASFWSMFPLPRATHFGCRFFEPQPPFRTYKLEVLRHSMAYFAAGAKR